MASNVWFVFCVQGWGWGAAYLPACPVPTLAHVRLPVCLPTCLPASLSGCFVLGEEGHTPHRGAQCLLRLPPDHRTLWMGSVAAS